MSFIFAWSKMGTRDLGPPRLWTQDRGAWTQNLDPSPRYRTWDPWTQGNSETKYSLKSPKAAIKDPFYLNI